MSILPPSTPPPSDVYEFLDTLASRLGMIRRGGERDLQRAAVWFIKWWRQEGRGTTNVQRAIQEVLSDPLVLDTARQPLSPTFRIGWGFDFEWEWPSRAWRHTFESSIEARLEEQIQAFTKNTLETLNAEDYVSPTQEKKRAKQEKVARRMLSSARRRQKS